MRTACLIPKIFAIVGALLGILVSHAAGALTFESTPSLNRVVAEATLAFRGTVSKVDYAAAEVSAKQTIPYENISITVEEDFGGASTPQLTLRQIGGRVPGHPSRFLIVPGLAELAPTERVYILANDTKQPFFATFFGDHTLFRIATDETGAQFVMNAHWQPLLFGAGKIWPVRGVHCLPEKEDRGRCRRTERDAFDVSGLDDVPKRKEDPLTPVMLDRLIRSWRDGQNSPGQTISASETAFAEALARFGRAVSAPQPAD